MDHANIYVRNTSSSRGLIQLYHVSLTYIPGANEWMPIASEAAAFPADANQRVGPLRVGFGTGFGHYTDTDQWWIVLSCYDGEQAGVYHAANVNATLTSKDSGHDRDFEVDTKTFSIKLHDGHTSASMHKRHSFGKIANVFVLMLENHSFDNIFGRSGLAGVTVPDPTAANFDYHHNKSYPVTADAPDAMPTDPGHEFEDVFEQLHGQSANIDNYKRDGGPYPDTNISGYAANYSVSDTEGPPPAEGDVGKIMACFDTPTKLPAIYALAQEFAICDHWFSSMPGPTWPNRYFAHGASSAGLDHSPSKKQMSTWETTSGFEYQHGSIFQALQKAGQAYRIYMDEDGPTSGSIPIVTSLKGLAWHLDTWDVSSLANAAKAYYPATYTFIEPNYGDTGSGFRGGSSQHPKDSVVRGEKLIRKVYQALRNSPLWESSMLVITYDEHGGFYDSVPPPTATPPGDKTMSSVFGSLNKWGFGFDRYGVRVPAVVVSPWIPAGTVSKEVYDHSSITATLAKIVGMPTLTDRDAGATTLDDLLTLDTPRNDCTLLLPTVTAIPRVWEDPELAAARDQEPLPESGNLIGFLMTAHKAELELTPPEERGARTAAYQQLRTRGGARAYLEQVALMVRAARDAHREAPLKDNPPDPA
ncbi:MAG: phospholipase C [Myxococcota bacterium]|jgi:phospholipase C